MRRHKGTNKAFMFCMSEYTKFTPAPSCCLQTLMFRCTCVGGGNAQAGLSKTWTQCACECLVLYMFTEPTDLTPVFGGDLNQHLIVHTVPDDVDTWHITQSTPEQQNLAVQGMCNLLQDRQAQVNGFLEGGLLFCTASQHDGFCSLLLC